MPVPARVVHSEPRKSLRKKAIARLKKGVVTTAPHRDDHATRMETYYLRKIAIYKDDSIADIQQLKEKVEELENEAMELREAELGLLMEARKQKERIKELEIKVAFYKARAERTQGEDG